MTTDRTTEPGAGRGERDAIRVGDHVQLKAGGEPMLVIAVSGTYDGTGTDGAGLYCMWETWSDELGGTVTVYGWLSESAVEKCDGPAD